MSLSRTDRIRSWLAWLMLKSLSCLPLRVSQWLGCLIGWFNYRLDTRAAKVTRTNLAICQPHLGESAREQLVRSSLLHTGMTMMETPAVWLGRLQRMSGWICQIDGEAILKAAIDKGKGVIVLLPHSGNWELLNVYFAKNTHMTALYQPPEQVYLQPIMAGIREHYGNEMVPTNVRGIAVLYRRLQAGGVTVVLPDQVPASGEFVPFFGMEALTDRLISRLISKTGAEVVCCQVKRLPTARGFRIVFTEPDEQIYSKDPHQSLLAMNHCVERCALDSPEQYQWEYKRFRQRPTGELRLYNYNNSPHTHHL